VSVALAEQIAPHTNVNVVSDVAVAAASARAALVAALLNVEANRNGIDDAAKRDELTAVVSEIEAQLDRADAVVATVRAI
jgi:formiminotetrahydrofolate cyclodeaminase